MRRAAAAAAAALALAAAGAPPAVANQKEEDLSDSVRAGLCGAVADSGAPRLYFDDKEEEKRWLANMSARLARLLPKKSILQNAQIRQDFLTALHYNAARAGLDPQLALAVIHVESAFRKYAISSAGARGYMQVMPFWVDNIGGNKPCGTDHNLFSLNTNLRYGTVILRHYLDVEEGDLFRALARYNGSLGRAVYPDAVFAKWRRHWEWQ